MKKKIISISVLVIIGIVAWSCMKSMQKSKEIIVKNADASNDSLIAVIESRTPVVLADGLELSLWATDSLAPDPIALDIDNQNRIYLTRTNRQKNSEFDIRGHRDWMTESISLQSVEDRRAFLRKIFAPEKSSDNDWLKDLNGDGSHDWRDLAVEKDEVWRLTDTNGDGKADESVRVLNDFHEEITDVAGGLLIRDHDAFIAIGPDLWRLRDTNGDGYYDDKTTIAHGFNIHIGFSGHGMSGIIEGPDGKIYWGIGDPGMSLIDQEGNEHHYPNQGVIVRCNPDGSDFEVFSHGHRNTHEFVFDDYGNMISSDNDGDHRGESERLVHIVEGNDSGWRINWQFGKYTDPQNNGYKVWMDEEMFKPRWDGQAAYFLPPIRNYHNGPTGMQFNPGSALGKNWLNKFFLVEFSGNPSRANIWSFGLKPNGATFDFDSEVNMLNGILATGIRFGTDGALYVADWVNGWNTKNYGRVWKIDVDENHNDLHIPRTLNALLISANFEEETDDNLYNYLSNDDMRVRLKAQFELVNRKNGLAVLSKAISVSNPQMARIHGIWGLGQMAAQNSEVAQNLLSLLDDEDEEIIAQAAKVLGDVRYTGAESKLIGLLNSSNARVQFYSAQASGRIKAQSAVSGLLNMLKQNNNEDIFIRHAAVLALSRIEDKDAIYELHNNETQALRLAAVLVLRKWQDAHLADFLQDEDEYIVAEAARAINDDWSAEDALPALAALIIDESISSEIILRRAINASLRVGGENELQRLIAFAQRDSAPKAMKSEALATIGTWANPSVLDRVDGRYRGVVTRDPEALRNVIIPKMGAFLDSTDPTMQIAAAKLLTDLEINGFNNKMTGIFGKTNSNDVKAAVLKALGALKYPEISGLVSIALKDKNRTVRTTALSMLNQVDIDAEALPGMVNSVLENGSQREKQQLLQSLGEMPIDKTEVVLSDLIVKLSNGEIEANISLDLAEAVEASGSSELQEKLESALPKGNIMDEYKIALSGGNRFQGYRYFNQNSTGQCVRCHVVGGQGGTVGPDLSTIGNTLSREEILQSLVEPSVRISPGYGTVFITLKDGQEVSGILEEETEDELIIRTNDAEPLEIAISRIAKRENMPSGMPPMAMIMSKREMRDVVEYLANLKK